jgi:hypothetical protein
MKKLSNKIKNPKRNEEKISGLSQYISLISKEPSQIEINIQNYGSSENFLY